MRKKVEMEDQGENKRVRNKIRNDLHLFEVLEFKFGLTKVPFSLCSTQV